MNADKNSKPIIKICGITRIEDGLAAIDAGADWLGFIRVPGTPRFRAFEDCRATLAEIRRQASRPFVAVGVFVDAPRDSMLREVERAGFDRVQLHGAEPASFIDGLPVPAIKTIKMRDARSIADADAYPDDVIILADAYDAARAGGAGQSYDPSWLTPLVARRRVIVAGGLNEQNALAVVRALHPFGVDASSGVEFQPGIKDAAKIKRFVSAVRGE